jgi:hypothetical protein
LIQTASEFVNKYDKEGKFIRLAIRNQQGEQFDKLMRELGSFGDRFMVSTRDIEMASLLSTPSLEQSFGRSCDQPGRDHWNG